MIITKNIFGHAYKSKTEHTIGITEEFTHLLADYCSPLADSRRLLLIHALSEHPKNVSELTERLGNSQPAVSRHLKILRERGLAHAQRQGSNVTCSLSDPRLMEALNLLQAIIREQWAQKAEMINPSSIKEWPLYHRSTTSCEE